MSASSLFLRNVVLGVGLAGLATAISPYAAAQQNNAVSGGLAGFVTDASGAAIPNANVTLTGPQSTVKLVSNAKGQYEARGLTPGLYTVTITSAGFSTFVSKANEVTIDHTSTLNASLSIGDAGVTVEVDGGSTSIDVENSSINTQLSDTFIEQLPLPRNVAGAFYVAPGVVSGGGTGSANPSIGGSSGLENNYSADGVTITDQAYGGLGVYTPQYGSLGTGINQTFVKELDIKTAAFEPKYGLGDGGIVEIVTKSGGNKYHAAISAYLTPGWSYASAKQLFQTGYSFTKPVQTLNLPQYEGSVTAGGYIMKDKLFFFGAFDPTLNQVIYLASPKATAAYKLGQQAQSTTSLNWAGKITYTPFANTVVELSSYGDPSRRNVAPESFESSSFKFVSDSYDYGTRNSTARVNTVLFKNITAFGAYAYSTEHFNDHPSADTYSISDRSIKGTSVPYGFGTYYKTKDANYTLQGELQANANLLGKHTAMIGYYYNHVDFDNSTLRTGANFAIPGTNAAGDSLTALYTNIPAGAIGQQTNASFTLFSAGKTGSSGCAYCLSYTQPNGGAPAQDVYFQQTRGTYKGSTVAALSRYKSAYGNEVYSPNRYVTLNAGLRWEQQTYGGSLLTYGWHDNWSPRLSATVDPFGDRKSKIVFAWSRYQNPLPLDAAIRQLGNEQDDTKFYFAPKKDANGLALVDASGAVVPDTSVALNGTAKTGTSKFGGPNFSSSTGEGILPGTKMEYADEFMLDFERTIKPGLVLKARYVDRHFGRIVEDIGSTSPEGANLDVLYNGGIANVSASSDFFKNENIVTYTPKQFGDVNKGKNGQALNPGEVSAATYVAPAPGCTYDNDATVNNGGYFTQYDGTPYNGACITNYATDAGTLGPDGKPDGFADPRRHYQGLELELDRNFSNHWQARINYRYAKLFGNYEGFFRNDNGQSDPGISSLFDFTSGAINLLGDQFKRGYLNSDRRHVANVLVTYTVAKDTPYLSKLNGVTVGTWIHALTGTPLSAYESHPVYLNTGEVPVGGRGTLGTTPVNLYADASLTDTFTFADKYNLKVGFDGFNVTNSQAITGKNQNLDTSPGSSNPDYNRPNGFVSPFRARFNLELSF